MYNDEQEVVETAPEAPVQEEVTTSVEEGVPTGDATVVEDAPVEEQFPTHQEEL